MCKTSLSRCPGSCPHHLGTITSSSYHSAYCLWAEKEEDPPISLSGKTDQFMSAVTDILSSLFQTKEVLHLCTTPQPSEIHYFGFKLVNTFKVVRTLYYACLYDFFCVLNLNIRIHVYLGNSGMLLVFLLLGPLETLKKSALLQEVINK